MTVKTKVREEKMDIANSVELREGTALDMSLKSDPWKTVVWNRLEKNRVAMYCMYYTVFIMFVAIFYPILIPSNPTTTSGLTGRHLGSGSVSYPSLRFPFGTDLIGRDVLTLLITSAYVSLLVGFGSTVVFLSIGVPLGLVAGYYGNKTEEMILRFADFVIALPFLIFVILLVATLSSSQNSIAQQIPVPVIILLVLGIFGWAGTTRLVTANTKQVINLEYVSAARTLGASDKRIILKHILPNVMAPIIVIATFGLAIGILSEAGLTFLGLGSRVNNVSYGTMIATGVNYVYLHPQLSLIPGFAIFFVVFAINLLGDALRDALDPRLKN